MTSGSQPWWAAAKRTAEVQPRVRTAVKAGRFEVRRVEAARQMAAKAAKTRAYARLLKRTSRTGQRVKAQKVGEKAMAEMREISPTLTLWAERRMGMASAMKP